MTNNVYPLVSVYIPTHNRKDMLTRALNSVLAQTYPNIEVIISDDGSSLDVRDYIEPLLQDPRITYLRSEIPQGACFARNKAIAVAKGEFITGLDDDDAFSPNRILELYQFYIKNNYSCVATGLAEHTGRGVIHRKHNCGEISLDQLLHHNDLGNQVFTKTSYLKSINGFSVDMPAAQDYDTWVRLVSKYGSAFKLASTSYLWYTDHELNRISNNSTKRENAWNLFNERHKDLLNEKQRNSQEIILKKITQDSYTVIEFFKLTNRSNWKSSLILFINLNMEWIKNIYLKVRLK